LLQTPGAVTLRQSRALSVLSLGCFRKYVAHRVDGALRRRFVVVGVPLQGESGDGVAGESLQVADGLAALGQQGQTAMPEVVEPDRRGTGPHEQGLEEVVDDVLSVERPSVAVGEDEPVILPF